MASTCTFTGSDLAPLGWDDVVNIIWQFRELESAFVFVQLQINCPPTFEQSLKFLVMITDSVLSGVTFTIYEIVICNNRKPFKPSCFVQLPLKAVRARRYFEKHLHLLVLTESRPQSCQVTRSFGQPYLKNSIFRITQTNSSASASFASISSMVGIG